MSHIDFGEFICTWTPARQPWSLARYRNWQTLGFSRDGASVYRISNEHGQMDLWRDASRITDLGDRVARAFVVEPTGATILAADSCGDENHQLYRVTADGTLRDLVVRDGVQHHLRARSLSRDGKRLAYSANHRDPANVEVVVRDLASGEESVVLGGDAWHVVGDWSPDGTAILASRVQDNTDQDLFLVDVRTGEATPLTPHRGDEKNFPIGFDTSGGGVYVLTDRGGDFLRLGRLELRSRELETVDQSSWDIEAARLDRAATTLVWVVNVDGSSRMCAMDTRSGARIALPDLGRGYASDFAVSADGRKIAVQWSSTAAPWSIRVFDREAPAAGWIEAYPSRLAYRGPLVEDEVIRVPSPRGAIPAMLLRPPSSGRVPLVLHVHGGPEDQEHVAYLALHQYLVAHGVAVLVPNIHGSTGYGSAYQRAIHLDWGGVDLDDIDALARWARSREWVDPDRIGIFGGSFGGFATLSAITRLPQYWRAAAEAFGPSDLVTMIKSDAPSWQRFVRRWVGDPERDAEKLHARSPLTHAANLRCPLLVLQGERDPRVAKSESDQIVKRFRDLGKDVSYIEQGRSGHGWTSREAYRESYGAIADFLLARL